MNGKPQIPLNFHPETEEKPLSPLESAIISGRINQKIRHLQWQDEQDSVRAAFELPKIQAHIAVQLETQKNRDEKPREVAFPCEIEDGYEYHPTISPNGNLEWYGDWESDPYPATALERKGLYRWYSRAEGRYIAFAKKHTGRPGDAEALGEAKQRRFDMEIQSHIIADKLQRAGIKAYRDTPFTMFRYAVHSRTLEEIPAFASTNFIPMSACGSRKRVLREVMDYMARQPYARFATFTNGERCHVGELRGRIQALSRKISKLNAEKWFKAVAEVILRSMEVGTLETRATKDLIDLGGELPRDEQGRVTYHPHAHVLYTPRKRISKKRWKKFLKRVRRFMGGKHWDDSGLIKEAREAVKYCSKPGEVAKLPQDETVALYNALKGLHLIETLGSLRATAERRRERYRTLVNEPTHDGPVLKEMEDWNRRLPQKKDKMREDMEAARKLAEKEAGEGYMFLVSRTVPMPVAYDIAEPVVILCGRTFDENAVRIMPAVAELIRATQEEWDLALPSAIRVHRCGKVVRKPKQAEGPPGPLFETQHAPDNIPASEMAAKS